MAAIYWHPEAYDTAGAQTLMGRHSAGESFIRGYIRHGSSKELTLFNAVEQHPKDLEPLVRRIEPCAKPIRWLGRGDIGGLRQAGVLNLPVPGLSQPAWARRLIGDTAYSLCGVTHTIATSRVMDTLADMPIAPVQPWDGLVCTSRAALRAIKSCAESMADHLTERLEARQIIWPQYAHIPLGINVDRFAPQTQARKDWRFKLNISDDDVAVLYFGRFSAIHKAHPVPMAMALEAAAAKSPQTVHWIVCGKLEDDNHPFEAAIRAQCRHVQVHFVDGRQPDVSSIWSAADIFLSFSDNIQETFGMTPVEAMAAGLPCVISDWDGYKDSVRHEIDGYRIATITPASGLGRDLALAHGQEWINYATYVASVAQFTAVDLFAASQALSRLIESPDLRRRMGVAAKKRAEDVFDWSRVVPQYETFWAELDARRKSAPSQAPRSRNTSDNPRRPDPFKMFSSYPTEWLTSTSMVQSAPGMTWEVIQSAMAKPLVRLLPQFLPSDAEVHLIVDALATVPQMDVGELLSRFPLGRHPFLERGVVWMAKHGLLRILGRNNTISS